MSDERLGKASEGKFYNSNWFTAGCELATKLTVKDRGKKKKDYVKKRSASFEKASKRFEKAKEEFKEARKKYRKEDERFWDKENKFNLERERYVKAKKRHEKHELNFSLKYLRFDIEPFQVKVFANFVLGMSLLSMLIADALIVSLFLFFFGILKPFFIFVMGAVTLLIPPVLGALILNYPKNQAKRVQIKTLGRLPETINYMSMSMYLNPSLNIAIEFASDSVDEPLATQLKKILWNVYIREFDSIEQSFLDFAFFCGRFNEEFKRALYSIRNAALEKTKEGIHIALDTANDIILEGTRRQMLSFANTLTGPTLILFSIGIMLPMIIGTLLPLLNVGQESLPWIVILMDIMFPAITLVYAYHILGKRPGTSTPPEIPNPLSRKKKGIIITQSAILFLAGLIAGIWGLHAVGEGDDQLIRALTPLPIIWGLALAIITYSYGTSKHQKQKRDRMMKMEEEFPDALYHLGSRIAEGKAFEDSLLTTSKSMEGTSIGALFRQMFYSLQVVRSKLKGALFGTSGILTELPSSTIKASMRTVVDSIKKDAAVAGATIIKVSRYLRQLKSVEKEIDSNLSSVRSMMLTTGALFGPVILGITIALYQMLTKSFTSMGDLALNDTAMPQIGMFEFGFGEGGAIAPEIFSLVIGIYLILTVLVIIYFCTNIKYGNDKVELKVAFVRILPVTLIVFTVTIVLSNLIFVG